MVEVLYKHLHNIIDELVPKSKETQNRFPVWFSRALIRLLNEKEKLRKRYKHYNNPRDNYEYKLLTERANNMIKTCYKDYMESVETGISQNPKAFWSFVKAKKSKSDDIPSEMKLDNQAATSGDEVCKLFATHFSSTFISSDNATDASLQEGHNYPQNSLGRVTFSENDVVRALKKLNVCKGPGPDGFPPLFVKNCASGLALPLKIILNYSIETAEFPSEWKNANVVPIFKKGEANNIKNYRPISILSVFSKVFESLMCPYLTSHFKIELASQQHGFCTQRSTTTNLALYVNDLSKFIDSRTQVDSIYTDFSSAFDKVDHRILLQKLSNLGIFGQLLQWFNSYLTNRKQRVIVKGYHSSFYCSTSGVPQGSHLGPILFLVFVNDIVNCIKHSECSLYADDVKFYKVINSPRDILLLQEDLNSVHNWCSQNRMTLNAEKCYHITFTKKRNLLPSSYSLNGLTLQKVNTIRDLGVCLDRQLTFIPHIDNIVKKATKMLGFLKRICHDFQSIRTLKLLYITLVRSILDYASQVWNPTYRVHIDRIERVQKGFTRYLRHKSNSCPCTADYADRLRHFNLTTLENRRKMMDQTMLFKIVNGLIYVPRLLDSIHISVPRGSQPRPDRKLDVFAPFTARTNLGRSAPLNRLMRRYNDSHSRTNNIDIFSNSLTQFRKHFFCSQQYL